MTGEARTKRRPMGKKQRDRKRRQQTALLDRDASMLPTKGPIADLIISAGAELGRCVVAGIGPVEAVDRLRPLGERALQLTGSARGVRAVAQGAIRLDPPHEALRRSMLNRAWNGIGDQADAEMQ